ncbi:MAG: hypothetical protein J0626_10615, partial [Rhodospirillaceae bacterium]|nr:hypothetical protein [Rhodospirillaceae bacterium]
MKRFPAQQHAGPIVWSGIVVGTCALLFLLQQMLFLAIPFLLAIVLYYILQPPMQRLIRLGVSHNAATLIVGSMFLLVLMLATMVAVYWEAGPSESWQVMLCKYLTGGLDFIRHT